MSERFRVVRERFVELCELDSGERAARLAALAADDAGLARELTELFASDRAAGDFLAQPAAESAGELVRDWLGERPEVTAIGRVVGAWRLVSALGRGGMGEVYVAERVDGGYQQRAALKLLKRGMDSDEIVRRFEQERQILARLTHPGIARLVDGGRSDDGRPYLVLELVDGQPITEFARETQASVAARVRLLVEACAAVDAAHRQLVVHRDLKPSNVLVESATGRVKLLDFGIAKLLAGGDDTELRLTRTGFAVMTPAYAAPEQILGEPATTATDVYALGVLLYELLTGELPHRRSGGSSAALAEAISKESVARPSRVAAERGDRRLQKALAGDLDTIVLRALAAEPERRYASVAALAADLERHLDGRPVLARAESSAYRLRKWVGRNPIASVATAAALVAILGGATVALVQARRAEREATSARREAARAERVRQFLVSVFEVSDPVKAQGATITAKQLLDEGAARVESELAGDDDLRAEMQDLLAGLYRKMGELDAARPLALSSLALRERRDGADSLAAARSARTLGWIEKDSGEFDVARPLIERAIARFDREGGAASLAAADLREPLVELEFLSKGPAAAQPVAEARLAIYQRELPAGEPRIGLAWNDLGVVLAHQSRFDEAETAYLRSLEILDRLPENDPRRGFPHNNLASLLHDLGRDVEAVDEAELALTIRRRALGPNHPDVGATLGTLAQVLRALERFPEAEASAREALAIFEGRDRFSAAEMVGVVAATLTEQGRHAEALPLYDRSIRELAELLPAGHVLLQIPRVNRARSLAGLGRRREAIGELESILPELERLAGAGADSLAKATALLERLRREEAGGA